MPSLDEARLRLERTYKASLARKLVELKSLRLRLHAGEADAVGELLEITHQLQGSGGSYGFPQITEKATAVGVADDENRLKALEDLIATVKLVASAEQKLEGSSRILVIEDDERMVEMIKTVLGPENIQLEFASTMAAGRECLSSGSFDIVLLDLMLPDGDGRDLLTELSDRMSTGALPVIVLSARCGTTVEAECLARGADQFFTKPIDPDLLRTAIHARLVRRHGTVRVALRDELTSLLLRPGFRAELSLLEKRCSESEDPLSIAILDIDRFKVFNDRHGHGTGDMMLRIFAERLKASLGADDIAGRWGGEEFLLAFPGMGSTTAIKLLEGFQLQLREELIKTTDGQVGACTFSGGVVEMAKDESFEQALRRADDLLYRAKASGRARVLDNDQNCQNASHAVLVVEDDEDLGRLLTDMLGSIGAKVDTAIDGQTGLELAKSRDYDLLVIDGLLPELSGIELLAAVREQPKNRETPVMMITRLGSVEHLERAFELGADDYIVKPIQRRQFIARARRLLRHAPRFS